MTAQAFESHEPLQSIIWHAANYWKVDTGWSELLHEINKLCVRNEQLEAENKWLRERISEALKLLKSRQHTTPGLGAPVTILKQALEGQSE